MTITLFTKRVATFPSTSAPAACAACRGRTGEGESSSARRRRAGEVTP